MSNSILEKNQQTRMLQGLILDRFGIHFGPFFERNRAVLLVQEVVALFVVDLEVAGVEVVLEVAVLGLDLVQGREEHVESPRDDTTRLPGLSAGHRVGLA